MNIIECYRHKTQLNVVEWLRAPGLFQFMFECLRFAEISAIEQQTGTHVIVNVVLQLRCFRSKHGCSD